MQRINTGESFLDAKATHCLTLYVNLEDSTMNTVCHANLKTHRGVIFGLDIIRSDSDENIFIKFVIRT
jgi:hypothetical protein